MIFHEYYADIPDDEVDRFVRAQQLGRLVTVGEDGMPHIGLYPFALGRDTIELHLVRGDEQVTDLRGRPRCLFEVDEVLGVIPSYWVHADYGGSATAYHRTVIFECEGTVSDDLEAITAQQVRLLERYQPESGFRSVRPDDPLYARSLGKIAALVLTVTRRRVKFKLGQNRPAATRRHIIEELHRRGRDGDGRAAQALASTIQPKSGRQRS